MAALTVTKSIEALRTLFNKISSVYLIKTPVKLASVSTIDMELPILSDGVSFDTGSPSIDKVKLTTGTTWSTIVEAGDPSIEFQVASLAGDVNELFMNKKTTTAASLGTTGSTVGGKAYTGHGFDLEPKKVNASLLMVSEDKATGIYIPQAEIYASLMLEGGKPAYFNLSITPVPLDGAEGTILVLNATA